MYNGCSVPVRGLHLLRTVRGLHLSRIQLLWSNAMYKGRTEIFKASTPLKVWALSAMHQRCSEYLRGLHPSKIHRMVVYSNVQGL